MTKTWRSLFILPFLALVCVFFHSGSSASSIQPTTLVFDTSLFVENDVEIKSRLSGVIEEILVDRGTAVRKGTPLALLENEELKLQMARARAVMQEAEVAYQRAKSLYDQQLLAASEYDQKRLAYDRSKTESELSRVNYEKSILTAPFAGVVVERYAHLGQRVVEDDNIPLFRITAMSPLLARIYVPEEQLGKLKSGMQVEFVPSLPTSQKVPARIRWISSVIDPATGLVSVILEIRNTPARSLLKPGTSGKIMIAVE